MKIKSCLLLFILLPFISGNLRSAELPGPPTCEITSPSDGADFDFGDSLKITGSSCLYFWDTATYQETEQIQVTENGGPVTMLNELEFFYNKILPMSIGPITL